MGMKQRMLIPVLLAVPCFCSPAAVQPPAPGPRALYSALQPAGFGGSVVSPFLRAQ